MNKALKNFALMMINNGNINRNDPKIQSMIQAIQNEDSTTGANIANNLCNSMGMSRDEAVNQAVQAFAPQINQFFK